MWRRRRRDWDCWSRRRLEYSWKTLGRDEAGCSSRLLVSQPTWPRMGVGKSGELLVAQTMLNVHPVQNTIMTPCMVAYAFSCNEINGEVTLPIREPGRGKESKSSQLLATGLGTPVTTLLLIVVVNFPLSPQPHPPPLLSDISWWWQHSGELSPVSIQNVEALMPHHHIS